MVSKNYWLNGFHRRRGVLKVCGLRAIVLRTCINYKKKHCQLETGQYVEVQEKLDSTIKWRTESALYLHPLGNAYRGEY